MKNKREVEQEKNSENKIETLIRVKRSKQNKNKCKSEQVQ